MSDFANNQPDEPKAQGGWYTPETPNLWKPVEKPATTETLWKVHALPENLAEEPATRGTWHLPAAEDTTFTADDEIEVAPPPSEAVRPEDLIAEIMGQAGIGGLSRPEDFVLETFEEKKPDFSGLDALEAYEERFNLSEYSAGLDLLQGAAQDGESEELGEDDLSLTSRLAMMDSVQQAQELLPTSKMTVEGGAEDAASYAARMAAMYSTDSEGTPPTAATTPAGDQPLDAADYARMMAEKYATGGTTMEETRVFPEMAQPSAPALSPQEQALADKLRATDRAVADLRQQFLAGTLSREDAYQRQQSLMVVDERDGTYWMKGVDKDVWYYFDRAQNNWVESAPPVPLRQPSPPTATSTIDPYDVLAGSLPYLPSASPANAEYSDPYSGAVGNFGQPVQDPNLTQASPAAYMNQLPNTEATLQGLNFVDATVPMSAVDNTMPMNASYTVDAPSYEDEDAVPIFDQYRERERNRTMRYLVIAGVVLVVLLALGFVAALAGITLWYNQQVEPHRAAIAALASYEPEFQTARILDATGELIVELNSRDGGAREVVTLDNISPYLIHAVLSTENRTYYDDPGFSVPAIARAFLQNLTAGEIQSGASTITQQVARNLILKNTETTADRKIQEILVAMEIANQYDKNFILQLYLNEFFFGNQSYGVEAAARFYFNKPAKDTNLAESALLAGIISAPSANDPVVNKEQAIRAMRNSLRLMLDTGCIQFQHGTWLSSGQPFCINETTFVPFNGEQVRLVNVQADGSFGGLLALQLAETETRVYQPRSARFKYPHFVNYVQSLIENQFGTNAMFQRGFTIYTTLNPRIQDTAEATLRQQVNALINNGVNTGSVMVTDPQTGAIRAMVGSPDFTNEETAGQVDNTRTWQQPGSSIKAVVYTAAIEGGQNGYLTPASILWDVPSTYPIAGSTPYQPTNFRNVFYGPTPLRTALQGSYNVSAVKAFEFIGIDKFRDVGTRMGLQFLPEAIFGLPTALGANEVRLIDMMKVYGTLANNGVQVPLFAIERITEDVGGVRVDVALAPRGEGTRAISPQVAYVMQNILSDDNARAGEFGRNGNLTLSRLNIPTQNYVGAKTGTSDGGRDLWTMGFTSNTVVGVWLGTFDNSRTVNVTGFTAASPVWNAVMTAAIQGRTPTQFANPGGVLQDTICRDTGTIAGENCANRTTDIYIQNQPPPPAAQGFVSTRNVDSWTGFIANEWCPENNVAKVFANISDPFAVNWLVNTPQGREFAARVGLPANLESMPTTSCSQGQTLPSFRINNPSDGQVVQGLLTITGQVSAPDFNRYDLEYASVAQPENFTRITNNTQQFPSAGSTLGTWDTTTLPNGQYILRLAAYSATGGFVHRTVRVTTNNIPPTATPAPPPTQVFVLPTPILVGDTPIPFDNLNPTATATLAP